MIFKLKINIYSISDDNYLQTSIINCNYDRSIDLLFNDETYHTLYKTEHF